MIYTEHPFGSRLHPQLIPRFLAADVPSLASRPHLCIAARDEMAAFVRRQIFAKTMVADGVANGPRDVADVSTGRDATEHLTEASPQRATLRLSGARVLRRGTERCWTRLITAGRPRYLGACRLYYKPPTPMPSTRIPFRLLRSAVAETAVVAASCCSFLRARVVPTRNTGLIPLIEIYRGSYGRFRRISRAPVNVGGCRVGQEFNRE